MSNVENKMIMVKVIELKNLTINRWEINSLLQNQIPNNNLYNCCF